MPVDREEWVRKLHLSHFINTGTQLRDLESVGLEAGNILIIGPGPGLDALVLRGRGYKVTTFDIDPLFNPDVQGSVHDLSAFDDQEFDAAIASHVLEHLPPSYLDQALAELAMVAKFTLIYLPVAGKHVHFKLGPLLPGRSISLVVDFYNPFNKPDPLSPKYMAGQHFWEVGRPGYTKRNLKARFENNFEVIRAYRNHDWLPSANLVLKSRKH